MKNLKERYIYAVTRNLPEDQRDDVSKELFTTIEDMVADRVGNGKSENKNLKDILNDLGHPDKLAEKYSNSKNCLIGPDWFFQYKKVLFIVLKIAPVVVAIITLISNLISGGWNPFAAVINAIGVGINVAIQVVFWVTLIFFMLERVPNSAEELEESWNLEMLPELPATSQISRAETIVEIIMSILFGGFILSLQTSYWNDNSQVQTFLSFINPEAFKFWIPAILGVFVIQVLILIAKYILGKWSTPLIIAEVGVNILSTVVLVGWLISGQAISPELYTYFQSKGTENIGVIVDSARNILIAVVTITAVMESVDAIRKGGIKPVSSK